MRKTTKFWIATAVFLTFVQCAASALLPKGVALSAFSDSASSLLFLALVIAFAQNAIPARGRLRVFWTMQAVAWSITLINQLWWLYYDVIIQQQVPMLFAGDVLLFLPGLLMLAGFLLRPHFQQSRRSARLGTVDFLLLMVWWVFFYAYLVSCWEYVSPNEALYNRNYDRLYFAETLVVLCVIALLIRQSTGNWRRFYLLYFGTVTFNYVWFAIENHAIEKYAYFVGSWYDCPYVASYAFFMVLAVSGRSLTLNRVTTGQNRYRSWINMFAIVAVLSLPVMVIVAIVQHGVTTQIMHFRVIVTALAMFAMASLVFTKLHLLHLELKHANLILQESSTTDPLTGIRNRRFFSASIQRDVAQSIRAYAEGGNHSERDLLFYLVDLDNFKKVNDLYGHDSGDRVLIEAARRISSAIRDSDLLVRWGGEEFLIISRSADRRQADILAQRVLEAFRATPFSVDASDRLDQTCSIGWAAFPWFEEDVETVGYQRVLKFADRALYRAKRAGKNQAVGMVPSGDGAKAIGESQLTSAVLSVIPEEDIPVETAR